MDMHKKKSEYAEKVANLTAQLRQKEEDSSKKDYRWVNLLSFMFR